MPFQPESVSIPERHTLAESTVQVLVRQMESGRWSGFLPGERILCEELQVSRPTLRQALKVLERDGRIETEHGKRRRITGHRAKSTPARRRNIVGLLSPRSLKSLPPYVLYWIDELRSNLAKCGYQLEFHHSRACATHKPGRALERMVSTTPSALWIVLLSTEEVQKWFMAKRVPCLVAGSCAEGIDLPSLDIDYHAACRHAAGVFRRAGHTRMALVIPANGLSGDAASQEGFREAAPADQPPLVLKHDGTRDDLIRQIEGALRLQNPPTAFLVARSAHVLTVLTCLLRKGIRIPEQAAVISRDDDPFLDFVTPTIARYRSDPEKHARHLSHCVLQMVRSGPSPDHPIRLMPQFQKGETV